MLSAERCVLDTQTYYAASFAEVTETGSVE
jgi:hypothetical protein